MELLQGGHHELGKLQYRQHGWGKAKRKLRNNIYIYILHCQCIFIVKNSKGGLFVSRHS